MADRPPGDRLQPSLLDRLTDHAPRERKEPLEARILTRQQLRAAVLRDLNWLLNATRPDCGIDADRMPLAARSVLAWGMPAVSGETASTVDQGELERSMHAAIADFEPRLDAQTLQVKAIGDPLESDAYNCLRFDIRGRMWMQPVPLEVLLRTQLDLETRQVDVRDAS